MKPVGYLKTNLGMTAQEFMTEWKRLTEDEKEWFRQEAIKEAALTGITLDQD